MRVSQSRVVQLAVFLPALIVSRESGSIVSGQVVARIEKDERYSLLCDTGDLDRRLSTLDCQIPPRKACSQCLNTSGTLVVRAGR